MNILQTIPRAGVLAAAGLALLAAAPMLDRSTGVGAQTPGSTQEATRSVLDGVYTEAQATRGQRVYETECSLCHGPRDFSGPVFQLTWAGQRVGALFTHVSMTMPLDNPGHLSPAQYADVVSYILRLNGYPAGEKELPARTEELTRILLERAPTPGR